MLIFTCLLSILCATTVASCIFAYRVWRNCKRLHCHKMPLSRSTYEYLDGYEFALTCLKEHKEDELKPYLEAQNAFSVGVRAAVDEYQHNLHQ